MAYYFKRVGAVVIDAFLCGFVVVSFAFLFFQAIASIRYAALVMAFILVTIMLIYGFIMELIWGKTIGKMIFKLKVISTSSSSSRVVPILLRNVFRYLDHFVMISAATMLIHRKRQRLGDIFSKTMVVETNTN
ncbi:RDD family protein [Paenibacillus daejeonensis]|uniref:RDD family protein n=1 Tax=Paenibacillus daejeonensis TaxID=135193 RepID=UPI00037CCDEF|nr:RDD family protein [Paenibacillus daejeonensis]